MFSKKPFSIISDNVLNIYLSFIIFLTIFFVYFSSKDTTPMADSRWVTHVAMSIIKEGNTDLNEYKKIIGEYDNYGVINLNEQIYYYFPIGTSVLLVPPLYLIDKYFLFFFSFDLGQYLKNNYGVLDSLLELFFASIISSLICVMMYFIGRLYLNIKQSLLLVIILAFATSLWSTSSRALWQHGPSALMLSLVLYLFLLAPRKNYLIPFIGLPLFFAYIIRPTNAVSILFFTILIYINYRTYFAKYLFVGIFFIIVPFIFLNLVIYHHILPPYYLAQRIGLTDSFFEALAGNLISPSRGLLIYSPIFLFVVWGIQLKTKQHIDHFLPNIQSFFILWKEKFILDSFIVGIVILHWVAISSFPHWWAGYCYGPRFFTDMMPYLVYLLIPVLQNLSKPLRWQKIPVLLFFIGLFGISFFTHYRGATEPAAAFGWNLQWGNVVPSIDKDPSRLWDWSDPQFWRGLRPAKLTASPSFPYVHIESNNGKFIYFQAEIFNMGDQDIQWEIVLPPHIRLVNSYPEHLTALNSFIFTFEINPADYKPGLHSLGGIYISGVTPKGEVVKNSPLVIPISLSIASPSPSLPNQTYHLFLPLLYSTLPVNKFIPPPDILTNGHQQQLAPDQIQAVYGPEWYDLEQLDSYSWRWTKSPATIYIYSPISQFVTLETVPVAFANNKETVLFNLFVNQEHQTSLTVAKNQPLTAGLNLNAGWNVLTLQAEDGNFHLAYDARELSFALANIILKNE